MRHTNTKIERSLAAIIAEHSDRYLTEYEDLLADFEGIDVIELLKETGRFLGLVAGEAAARSAMCALLQAAPVFHHPDDPDDPWDVQVENVGPLDALKWPAGHLFFELNAYAYGGFYVRGLGKLEGLHAILADLYAYIARQSGSAEIRTAAEREAALQELIRQCALFLDRVPTDWKLDLPHLPRTLGAAQARWALDHDQPLHPDGLAYLGRLNPRTLRNMMSAGQFSPVDGRIAPEEALTWLATRKGFQPSVWREQDRIPLKRSDPPAPYNEVLFVPVARDGSMFHPGLIRDGKFTIGDPGEQVMGYNEALKRLQRMPIPRWWRPNKKDNWGLVAGVRWERKDAGEMGALEARE